MPHGDLPVEINWYLNSKTVVEYAGITSSKVGKRNLVLNIESVTAEHSGNYTCLASNRAGTVNYTADLEVNGTKKRPLPILISYINI